MHIRRSILEFIRAQLKTLDGFAGVWIQRIGPARAAYPCITVYVEQETVDTETIHSPHRPQDRLLTIVVTAWIKGTSDDEKAEKDMDAAALRIEMIMALPDEADDLVLVATDFNIDEDEPDIHSVTLTYTLNYVTTELSPTI